MNYSDLKPPPGVKVYSNQSGAVVSETHISAWPGVTQQDVKAMEAAAEDKKVFAREINLDDSVYAGKAVYPQYDPLLHETLNGFEFDERHTCTKGIIPGAWHIRGYDFALMPACAWLQIAPPGQIQVFGEVQAMSAAAVEFAPVVRAVTERFPGFATNVYDFGDPAGNSRDQGSGKTAIQIFEELEGIKIALGDNSPDLRMEAMKWALTDIISEREEEQDGRIVRFVTPRFAISRDLCPILTEGLRGGYCLKEMQIGQVYGSEMPTYSEKPVKNYYSHLQDALQQAVIPIFQWWRSTRNPGAPPKQKTIVAGRPNH